MRGGHVIINMANVTSSSRPYQSKLFNRDYGTHGRNDSMPQAAGYRTAKGRCRDAYIGAPQCRYCWWQHSTLLRWREIKMIPGHSAAVCHTWSKNERKMHVSPWKIKTYCLLYNIFIGISFDISVDQQLLIPMSKSSSFFPSDEPASSSTLSSLWAPPLWLSQPPLPSQSKLPRCGMENSCML